MNRGLLGAAVAATFALGILTGAAGTIIVRDAAAPSRGGAALAGHMTDMGSMMSMMGGSTMGGSMMGNGGSVMPSAPAMPGGWHEQHHPGVAR